LLFPLFFDIPRKVAINKRCFLLTTSTSFELMTTPLVPDVTKLPIVHAFSTEKSDYLAAVGAADP